MEHKKGPPGVTTVINLYKEREFLYWYGTKGWDHCQQVKKESTELGKAVHSAVELLLKGEGFQKAAEGLTEQQRSMLAGFATWIQDNRAKPVEMNGVPMIEQDFEVARPDNLSFRCIIDAVLMLGRSKQPVVVDWKTSKKLDKKGHNFQLGGYSLGMSSAFDLPPAKGIIVRVGADLSQDEYVLDRPQDFHEGFMDLRKAFKIWTGR